MKLLHRVRRIFSDKGLLLTLALSLAVMTFFFGRLLLHPGKTYFGASGDGMQIYYETIYHIKYDSEYWRQHSVNYPYGESIFFTGAMPFVNNVAKLFGSGAGPFGVALINLLMLFSPVIGALFLYGIFRHMRLPWFYGALCATTIAFLSPQMARFTGHYSLSWVFLLPAMIYLLLRFYDYPSLRKSFTIAFLAFLGATTHLYFLVFFGLMGGFYWATLFFTRDRGFGRFSFVLKHFAIQFLLPFALIEIITMLTDHVSDRTAAPWGFLNYHSSLEGVFFPFQRPYESFFHKFINPDPVEFEGVAYVGLVAMAGLVTVTAVQLYRLARLRFRLLLSVTDSKVLNIFFWSSLPILWFSFGHPFIGNHEEWVVHLGPLRQFRAIGRFSWIFFYIVNIIAVCRIYRVAQQKKFLRAGVMILLPAVLAYDMYYNVHGMEDYLSNRIEELEDTSNQLPQDQWLKGFNAAAYQAILPLPYFNTGSENLSRVVSDQDIIKYSFIVSLKTGLPMMGVISARTSIGQTENILKLVLDPLRPVPVLKDLPDQRPLLLVVRPATLDENEQRIVSLAKHIASSNEYELYSVLPSALASLQKNQYAIVKAAFDSCHQYAAGEYLSNDSNVFFIHRSFDNGKGKPFTGSGSFTGSMRDHQSLLDTTLRVPGDYLVSFWVHNIGKDLYPRGVVEVAAVDDSAKVQPFYSYFDLFGRLRAIDGEWGLLEFPLTLPAPSCHVTINTWNLEMKQTDYMEIDDLLMRPVHTDLYKIKGDTITRNGRIYYPSK